MPKLATILFVLALAPACSRGVKADFPRPPATASVPPPAEPEEPKPTVPAPPVTVERTPPPEPEPPVDLPPPEPAVAPPEASQPEPEGETEEAPPQPPSTQLSTSERTVDPEIAAKLERATSLLGSLGDRELSSEQREQVTAARSFVAQARRALEEGDARRAVVLIDKGVILAEDVERTSR